MLENAIEHLTDEDRWWYTFDYINEITEQDIERLNRRHPDMEKVLQAALIDERVAGILAVGEEMHRRDQELHDKRCEKKGEKRGRVEGKVEGEAEIINLLLKGGMNINDIAKYTGLSLQAIEKLLSKCN